VSANDFLVFYLALELQSFTFYILAASRGSILSAEAGLKYFIQGSFSSALVLFGISVIYGLMGSINFLDLTLLITPDLFLSYPSLTLSFFLLLSGFFFKLSVVPFHFWAPEVYQGVSPYVAALLVLIPKFALLSFLIRIIPSLFWPFGEAFPIVFDLINLGSIVLRRLSWNI